MKRGAIAGADVDPAHRRRGAVPRRATPAPCVLVTDARHVERDARRRSSGSPALRHVLLVGRRRTRAGAPARACTTSTPALAGDRRAGSRRIRRAPTTPPTSSTPRAPPAIRRACCTRTARCSAASRRRSTGSTSLPGGDRVLHSGKYNWTYVLGTGLMDPLYRGHTAIVHEGATDAAHLAARSSPRTARPSSSACRPSTARSSRRPRAARADVPTLRHCMSAGEQLSDEVLAAWRERFGLDIYEGLGMTECSYYLCEPRARPDPPGLRRLRAARTRRARCSIPTTLREVRGRRGGHALHPAPRSRR